MREGLINEVETVIHNELVWSYDKHGKFNSTHEGYAVILEEVQEAQEELKRVMGALEGAWSRIRNNENADVSIKLLGTSAKLLACEASQIAAMANKYIESAEGWKE